LGFVLFPWEFEPDSEGFCSLIMKAPKLRYCQKTEGKLK
jgi:hypothetical protein